MDCVAVRGREIGVQILAKEDNSEGNNTIQNTMSSSYKDHIMYSLNIVYTSQDCALRRVLLNLPL